MKRDNDTVAVAFYFRANPGKKVFLAGDFNGWDPWATKMTYRKAKGIYDARVRMARGVHQYKFVIDGTWCADPENVHAIPNDFGSFNSLVTVE